MTRDEDLEEKIHTGNGEDRDLVATNTHILKKSVIETRDLKEITEKVVLMQKETTKSVRNLTIAIKTLDGKNEILQKKIFTLSVITGILALAQLLVALLPLFKWLYSPQGIN
jgi:hypothetical protein